MARYNIDNISYPSVTQITSQISKVDGLIQWAANCAVNYIENRIREIMIFELDQKRINKKELEKARIFYKEISKKAMKIGSEVHQLIEFKIKDKKNISTKDYDSETIHCYEMFLEWEKKIKPKWIASEMTVYDPVEAFAGTLDAICYIKGIKTLIDFKTNNYIGEEIRMQLAAYKYAYDNYHRLDKEEPVSRLLVLQLKKDGVKAKEYNVTKYYSNSIKAFFYQLNYYYLIRKKKLKNNWRCK